MRIKILYILLIICYGLSANSFAQSAKEREKIAKHGIKSITETKYKFKVGSGEKVFAYKVAEKYDRSGNVIEKAHYDAEGKLITKTAIKYDEKGNEIECANYDADGTLLTKTVSKYDGRGNKTEYASFDGADKLCGKFVYTYDAGGVRIYDIVYGGAGDIQNKHAFTYDGSGRVIEIVHGDSAAGDLYKYNARGNELEDAFFVYGKFSNDNYKNTHKYDQMGNRIEFVNYGTDGKMAGKIGYKYNARGNKIETTFYGVDGKPTARQIFKYDEKGNAVEGAGYGIDGTLAWKDAYKYRYDGNGNPIERTEYQVKDDEEIPRYKTAYEYELYK